VLKASIALSLIFDKFLSVHNTNSFKFRTISHKVANHFTN